MQARCYSLFWLAGGVLTDPAWAARDAAEDADPRWARLDSMPMNAWLALPDASRGAIVEAYAERRPKASRLVRL